MDGESTVDEFVGFYVAGDAVSAATVISVERQILEPEIRGKQPSDGLDNSRPRESSVIVV